MSFNLINPDHKFLKKYCTGEVIDVGAHIGDYSKFFSRYAKKVHAFEPTESSYKLLLKNTGKKVFCHSVALGKEDMVINFYTDGISACNSGVPLEGFNKTSVMQARLDYFEFSNISLIKIDAEGMDYEVLLGGEKTIQRNRPAIFVEVKPSALVKRGYSSKDIYDFMKKNNYTTKKIDYCYEGDSYDLLCLPQ